MSTQSLVTVIGHVGRKPDLRYTTQGTPVATISLAVNRKMPNGQNHVQWFNATAWRQHAMIAAEHLDVGDSAVVTGHSLEEEAFTRSDGTAGTGLKFQVTGIVFGQKANGKPEMRDEEDISEGARIYGQALAAGITPEPPGEAPKPVLDRVPVPATRPAGTRTRAAKAQQQEEKAPF